MNIKRGSNLKNCLVNIIESIDSLNDNFEKVLKIHQHYFNYLKDFLKTDLGKSIKEKIDASKNSQGYQIDWLNVQTFKSGLAVGADTNKDLSFYKDDLQILERDSRYIEFLKEINSFNDGVNVAIKELNVCVDMFFANFLKYFGKTKNRFFWGNYEKILEEICCGDIKEIDNYLGQLKELQALRNGVEHCKNTVDEKFASNFNLEYKEGFHSKFIVSLDSLYIYFIAFFKVFSYLINFISEFDFAIYITKKSGINKIKVLNAEWEKAKKKQFK